MKDEYQLLSDCEIISKIGMAKLPLIIYHLHRKYDGQYQLIDIGRDCMFRYGETNVANVSYLAVYIHFLTIKNGFLRIEGNVSLPAVIKEHFKFLISVNGEKFPCETYDAGLDLKIDDDPYETRSAFNFECALPNTVACNIKFVYVCDETECESGKINCMRFSPVSDMLENQYALIDNFIVSIKKNQIKICLSTEKSEAAFEEKFISSCEQKTVDFDFVQSVRSEYFRRKKEKHKPIWLFSDRLNRADDNGEAFFEYAVNHICGKADCYFIISETSPDYNRLKNIGPVINAFSKEHCVLLLLADYIFASQINGWTENPFHDLEEYFRDLYHHARVVFLQHGVTKDDQTKWLNKYNQNLYSIITSSEYERKSFLEYPYHYCESQIWNVGMPRLDKLYHDEKRCILFMPTWRKYLMEHRYDTSSGEYRWFLKDGAENDDYFKEYQKILCDKKLIKKCEKFGYNMIFMPHPLLRPYADHFKTDSRVIVPPYYQSLRELFAQCDIMVTDYSSVAFDFAYLKKPVIYYQFDKQKFQETHTYREGYFDYEQMGFGEVVNTCFRLKRTLCEYIKNNCSEKEKYEERCEKFYTRTDQKNSERLLEKVLRQE